MKKVLATPRSFAKHSSAPVDLLAREGFTVVRNPAGNILTKAQMIDSIADCEGVIIGVDPLDKDVLDAAPNLRAIAKYGTGTDNIDLAHAAVRGIPVSVTAGANSNAVADYAFAMMLALARNLVEIDRNCRARDWKKVTGADIYGKTLGIIGLGAIGRGMAKRASGFDMRILGYDPFWNEEFAQTYSIVRASVEQICMECDVITLHVPLSEQTRHLIGRDALARMKPEAILINTARGGIVDEEALLEALTRRRIRGAGIDAFRTEPPDDPRWYALDNLLMGNHAGAATIGAAEAMSLSAAENLLKDLLEQAR